MALRGVACNSGSATATSATAFLTQSITSITNANPAVVTLPAATSPNPFSIGTQLTFSGVATMTQINGLTGTITAIGGVTTAWTCTVNIDASGWSAGTGGTAAINMQAGDTVLLLQGLNSGASVVFPAGFASVPNLSPIGPITNSQASSTFSIGWKTATGTDASYAIGWGGAGLRWTTFCAVYSGRAANPFVVNPISTGIIPSQTTTTNIPAPFNLLNSNLGDDLVLLVMAGGSIALGTPSLTPAAGFANATTLHVAAGGFEPIAYFADNQNAPRTRYGMVFCSFNEGGTDSTPRAVWLISLASGAAVSTPQSGQKVRRLRRGGLAMGLNILEWF